MLRSMILFLSFLLITLSAAHLGQDEQLIRVLRLRTPPALRVQEEAQGIPIESPAAKQDASAAEFSAALPESRPPRFVLDEPLPEYSFPLGEEEPFVSRPLDPSAHALVNPTESREDYIPPLLTEEQKLKIAEPFVKELFALKENALRAFGTLGDQAIGDYLAADPSARSAALPEITARYLPQVQTLTEQADRQADEILLRLTAALTAIGADDAIARDARAAYEQSKQQEIDRYTRIFSELPS